MTQTLVIGDGIAGRLVVERLLDGGEDVLWSSAGEPTLPPVALLHRHVGRSFQNDPPEEEAWRAARDWARTLPASAAKPVTMFRPTSNDSRLSSTYDELALKHVHETPVEDYPFLSPCKRLFRYDDAWAVVPEMVLNADLEVERRRETTEIVRSGRGWRATFGDGSAATVANVVIAAGMASNAFIGGLPLKARPGELAVVAMPNELPADVAVSRNGHLAPTPDGASVCVGATYRDRMAEARALDVTAADCLDGIARSVPSLRGAQPERAWFGTRAVVHPDRRPLAGPTGVSNVWLATGLASKGMLWAARVAEIVADGLRGKPVPEATDPRRVGTLELA